MKKLLPIWFLVLSLSGFSQSHAERKTQAEQSVIIVDVKKKDTLYSIAEKYGVDPLELAKANNLRIDSKLKKGTTLIIPPGLIKLVVNEENKSEKKAEPDKNIPLVLSDSGRYFKIGLQNLLDNRRPQAREDFDKSIEVFLMSGINIYAERNENALNCFNSLTESIYRIEFPNFSQIPQIRSLSSVCDWNIEADLADKVAKLLLTDTPQKTTTYNPQIQSVIPNMKQTSRSVAGFTEQKFEPSPLDDLAKLEPLSDEKQKVDTWQALSNRTGISVADLMAANPGMVVPNKKVIIPFGKAAKSTIYQRPNNQTQTPTGGIRVVKAVTGDTVAKIALRNGVNPVDVANLNGFTSINTSLQSGREIKIPVDFFPQKQIQVKPTSNDVGVKPSQAKDGKVKAVMEYFNEFFNDPYSMRFVRWSPVEKKAYNGKIYWAVQVKFRAKNAFGAYILADEIFFIKNNKVIATQKAY
jgi:LysM repeat protein